MKKLLLTIMIFTMSCLASNSMFALNCKNCSTRSISPEYYKLQQEAVTGDLILVNSEDFFSRMIRDTDQGCDFSGIKIVFKEGGNNYMLVSDASHLADNSHGLIIAYMEEYFKEYDSLKIALFRPKTLTEEHKSNLFRMAVKAGDPEGTPTPYDFAADTDNSNKLTCGKMVNEIYGDSLINRKRELSSIFRNAILPCDLRKENLDQLTGWISFWR